MSSTESFFGYMIHTIYEMSPLQKIGGIILVVIVLRFYTEIVVSTIKSYRVSNLEERKEWNKLFLKAFVFIIALFSLMFG